MVGEAQDYFTFVNKLGLIDLQAKGYQVVSQSISPAPRGHEVDEHDNVKEVRISTGY